MSLENIKRLSKTESKFITSYGLEKSKEHTREEIPEEYLSMMNQKDFTMRNWSPDRAHETGGACYKLCPVDHEKERRHLKLWELLKIYKREFINVPELIEENSWNSMITSVHNRVGKGRKVKVKMPRFLTTFLMYKKHTISPNDIKDESLDVSLARVKRRTLPRWMLLLLLSSAQITKKVSFKVGSSFLSIWTLTWSNSALKPLKNHRLNPFQYNSLRLLHPQNFVSQCIDNDQVLVIEFSTYLDTPWLSCFPILSL